MPDAIDTLAKIQAIEALRPMGLRVLEESRNVLRIALPQEGNGNHVGGVYAGALFTLAEFPFGMMCLNRFSREEIIPVIGEMTIRYLAPASGEMNIEVRVSDDEWDRIEAETKANGKCKVIRDIEIKDAQGRVNAVARGTYFTLAVGR